MMYKSGHKFYGNQYSKNSKTPEERFWSKVNIKSDTECWEWTGSKSKKGYGLFDARCGESRAHRVSWMFSFGNVPNGVFVLHSCDNPSCVNPNHLFLGSAKDNTQDMIRKSRDSLIGSKNSQAKLSEVSIVEIKTLYQSGISISKISSLFNVVYETIWDIVNGNTWKHIK